METFARILEILDVNVIFCLLPLLLTVMLIEALFKDRFRTKEVINFVRWIIIGYTVISIAYFIIGVIVSPDEFAIVQRATGQYAFFYWLMFIAATIFPLTLLHKRIGRKPIYILLVILLMKIGFYFERFVIIVTRFHRDYAPNNDDGGMLSLVIVISVFLLQGFILAVASLGIFELLARIKAARNSGLGR